MEDLIRGLIKQEVSNTMDDDNTEQPNKERKPKWATSYSIMTTAQAEKRLGFRIRSVEVVPVDSMLANIKYRPGGKGLDIMLKTKERIYDNLVDYLVVEGYPTEGDSDFKEGNVNDLVYGIIGPVLASFIRITGRKSIQLWREKEIISVDGETGGTEEFVMVDLVSVTKERFVLIVEAKSSSLGQAMRQCLVAMKDMGDKNADGGILYGFITTGESWRMLQYDGTSFKMTRKIEVLFEGMGEENEKETWMRDYSILVDCMYAAISERL